MQFLMTEKPLFAPLVQGALDHRDICIYTFLNCHKSMAVAGSHVLKLAVNKKETL